MDCNMDSKSLASMCVLLPATSMSHAPRRADHLGAASELAAPRSQVLQMLCSKAQDISAAAEADDGEPQESTRGNVVAGLLAAMCSSESAGLPAPSPLGTEGDVREQCKSTEEQTSGGSEHQCCHDAEGRDIRCKDAVNGRSYESP